MAITITLPDNLKPILDRQVERMGYSDISAYLHALIQDDLDRVGTARLEALLIEGLDSAPIVMDQAAKDALIVDSEAILARYANSRLK